MLKVFTMDTKMDTKMDTNMLGEGNEIEGIYLELKSSKGDGRN